MSDTTERDAQAAEEILRAARAALVAYQVLPTAVTSAMSQIRSTDEILADSLEEGLNNATRQVTTTLGWLDKSTDGIPSHVTANPGDNLKTRAKELITQARIIDSSTFTANLQDVSRLVRELHATTILTEGKDLIRQEVTRLAARRKIEGAKKLTDTGSITRKASDLTKHYVTNVVRDHFTREAERLNLQRITLDPKSGRKGMLEHLPTLLGAFSPAPVTRVLSEGEQTALGLAGFITEVEFDLTKSAVLFDDPVTSLDHVRRSIVAERLVELAKERQVIIFTHEVTFVGDLVKRAGEERVSVAERRITRKGERIGICSEKFPWKAQDVKTRIDHLGVKLDQIRNDRNQRDPEEYEKDCADWAGELSETWERAVNLEIVYEVVDRGTSEVRPRKFRILAAITDQDNQDLQAGYSWTSRFARRHDKDPEVNFVVPEPHQMQIELDRMKAWFDRIKSYSK